MTVLAIINSINIQYGTNQTQHVLDGEHFDKQAAVARAKRPCGYFTVAATEMVTKSRTEMVPNPAKFEDNFPALGAKPTKGKQSTADAMIQVTRQYTESVPITDLTRTDLDRLRQKSHQNQLIKAFFWSYGALSWTIETQPSGPHAGSQVAKVGGPIPAPYGGMTDAAGGVYRPTDRMVVVLGGSSGANYQVITAYPA